MSKSQYYFDQRYLEVEDPWGIFCRPSQIYRLDGYLKVIDKLFPKGASGVLEIACANGYFTKMLAKRADHILAIDYSLEMIALAKAANQSGSVEFRIGSIPEVNFGSDKFELVTALEVILYLSKEEKKVIFLNIWKMLKKDGFFIFTEEFEGIRAFIDDEKFEIKEVVETNLNFLNLQDHVYNVARRLSFLINFTLCCKKNNAYAEFAKKYRHKPLISFLIFSRPVLFLLLPLVYLLERLMYLFYSSRIIHSFLIFLSRKFNYRAPRQTIAIQKI